MMNTDTDNLSQERKAEKLEALLKNREENRDERVQNIVENSREKARMGRMNSADVDSLSKNEKAERLEKFLKRKRAKYRKRQVTVSDVKAEAAKILEEFLRSQLERSAVPVTSPVGKYERYVEVDIIEETTPSSEGSGINRQDSIPFADEEDALLMKAESLPSDNKEKYLGDNYGKLKEPIYHEKSKSAPDSSATINIENIPQYVPKRAKTVPPPPPPGTPHSVSEGGSDERVPYVGIQPGSLSSGQNSSLPRSTDTLDEYKHSSFKSSDNDSSGQPAGIRHPTPPRQPPDSLNIIPQLIGHGPLSPLSEKNGTKSYSSSPSPRKSSSLHRKLFKKSGSVSSSDTDERSSGGFRDRKKKSMFKKAQERLRSFLKIQSDKESPSEAPDENFDHKPPKRHKKKQKHDNKGHKAVAEDEMDVYEPPSAKVLEERFTHTNKRIGQHHVFLGGGLVRTEDATEVVDVKSGGEKKHIEKRWKIRESSDSDRSIIGKLRRLTSREKSGKKHMKGSKSSTFEQRDKNKQYKRTISAPGQPGNKGQPVTIIGSGHNQEVELTDGGFAVTDIDRGVTGHKEHIKATQVVSRPEDIRRNSSCLDIVDHAGALVEKIWFDPSDDLPRNNSFEFNLESCVHEAKIKEKGKVRTVRDVDMHQHLDIDEDLEMDGITEEQDDDIDDMTQEEREKLYGVIAERLAAIGDSYTIKKQEEATTPRGRITIAAGTAGGETSNSEEISRQHLNPLEIELSDALREVAENIDEKLSEHAREAALRIAGVVTYNQFKKSVGDAVGNEIGWNQVSALFNITKRAIQLAGASGALAMQIKEMSLRYFEDKFAGWIVGQGGWDSVLEDGSTDSELD